MSDARGTPVTHTAYGLAAAFPDVLAADVAAALATMPATPRPCAESCVVTVGSEDLRIPYRIYADEPAADAIRRLTPNQRTVLHCLYTRHPDGHVRQRHVQAILPLALEWIAPFVVHLIGEYVLEIVADIHNGLADVAVSGNDMSAVYGRFAAANPDFLVRTRQRAASYWNWYHRARYPRLADYPATPLLTAIRNAAHPVGVRRTIRPTRAGGPKWAAGRLPRG
ncbi:hypothetical protein ACFFWC_08570 [Plantactinospora siamensis]|uniref:Uncharacterized protein n=1 Tax=Plantactinospora siamensis TaxID=555372 RepID=A0ABV6P422_9ACTN